MPRRYTGLVSSASARTSPGPGSLPATGTLGGVDPREMGRSQTASSSGVPTPVGDAGQCDDACCPGCARSAARRSSPSTSTRQPTDAAGRSWRLVLKPGTDACTRLRGHARRSSATGYADRDYLATPMPTTRQGLEAAPQDESHAGMGCRNHRSVRCDEIEAFAQSRRYDEEDILPPRLWVRPPAQWRGRHACRSHAIAGRN